MYIYRRRRTVDWIVVVAVDLDNLIFSSRDSREERALLQVYTPLLFVVVVIRKVRKAGLCLMSEMTTTTIHSCIIQSVN
jgi:hypothetical protein